VAAAASPASLRHAAGRVEAAGRQLAPSLDRVTAELVPTVWLGPGATRLAADVGNGRGRLVAAHAALVAAAAAMRAAADRIDADVAASSER